MNQYESEINTFIGPNLYNLGLPVLPPAVLDLSSAANFAPSNLFFEEPGNGILNIAFNKAQKPYIHGIGLFCNMAGGLIFQNTSVATIGFQLKRIGPKLTGTIANTAGSATITGTGTLFTQELAVGQIFEWYDNNEFLRFDSIAAIASDTSLTLGNPTQNTGMYTGNTTIATAYPLITDAGDFIAIPIVSFNQIYDYGFFLGDVSKIYPPQGVFTVASGSPNVVGSGTAFTDDFVLAQAVQWKDDAGNIQTGIVNTITDDTHLTLAANAPSNVTQLPFLFYDDHLRVHAYEPQNLKFSTINLDPRFFGVPLVIDVMVVIETGIDPAAINLQ